GELQRRRQPEIGELDLAVRRHTRAHEGAEGVADFLRVLFADQSERNLGGRLARDDGLGALAGIAADDAVYLGGRPRGDLLEKKPALLAGRLLEPDLAEKLLGREIERGELGLDVGRQVLDAVIKAGNDDAAVVVPHRAENLGQEPQRILRRPAEQRSEE